jgi:uncharacterized protein with PQ loop repeat
LSDSSLEKVKIGNDTFECLGFNVAGATTVKIQVSGAAAGLSKYFIFQYSEIPNKPEFLEVKPNLVVRVLKSRNIYYLDQSIGWLYFILWSVSFYPQVIMNYRRQSVVGFNFDYLGYDLVGFISFTMYNCLLYWSPAVFYLYLEKYPGSANPIQFNDVFFCLHAIFIQSINLYQCLTYESNNQKLSIVCKIILSLTVTAITIYSIIVGFQLIEGMTHLV